MEIILAAPKQFQAVRRYDSHIPSIRLRDCIHNNQVYALQDGGNVIGVLRYSLFWQTIPFLDLLYIDEDYRGKGYGRQMMDHWEAQMADLGYPYVMLSTQADETAKYFYEKLGYRRIGAFLPPEQEADELLYLKELVQKTRP
ncbi:MAG: GNAT family N-acetyltransferase [Clostridiales bacterium]|nr:GNAT family N-acetyltransferase [Clostridiales bacterium]